MPADVENVNILKAMFPISNNIYWYITAYFGLFIISPFLINSIKKYSNDYVKKLFVIIYLFFSIIGTIFNLVSGYTILWLVILFLIGIIYIYKIKRKQLKYMNLLEQNKKGRISTFLYFII